MYHRLISGIQKKERDECFAIELGECDGGAELGKIKKTIVTIVNDDGM
jgi:hypothetical protein